MATPVSMSNFVLIGWGTGASISAVSGDQTRCQITITAGTGAKDQPSVTFDFPNGAYPVVPISMAFMTGGTGVVSDIASNTTNFSTTFIYDGLPIAGKTYIFTLDTLGV